MNDSTATNIDTHEHAPAAHAAAFPTPKVAMLPLNLFGAPLGLAALGAAWSGAQVLLNAPVWPVEGFYGIAAILWLALTFLYLWRGLRHHGGRFHVDLRDPGAGPYASFIPLVGILLASHYSTYFPVAGKWTTYGFVAALAVVAAQLFAHWITGGVRLRDIHPGYFIPVVAGSFVASIGLTTVGAHNGALAALGIGAFFWLVVGTVVTSRLMVGGQLPIPVKPSLAAFVAAPAAASVAWIVSHPGPMGAVQDALTGILVMMLLVQVLLLGTYSKLRFNLSFWVFTFPAASTSNYAVRWFAASGIDGWQIWAWAVLGVITAFVVFVGVRSLRYLPPNRAPKQPLTT